MLKRFWVIVVVVAVGVVAAARLAVNAQAPKPAPAEAPFKGKVVVFALKKDAEKVTALQDPSIKRLGETDFLTGQMVGSSDANWRLGAVMWIPVVDLSGACRNFMSTRASPASHRCEGRLQRIRRQQAYAHATGG